MLISSFRIGQTTTVAWSASIPVLRNEAVRLTGLRLRTVVQRRRGLEQSDPGEGTARAGGTRLLPNVRLANGEVKSETRRMDGARREIKGNPEQRMGYPDRRVKRRLLSPVLQIPWLFPEFFRTACLGLSDSLRGCSAALRRLHEFGCQHRECLSADHRSEMSRTRMSIASPFSSTARHKYCSRPRIFTNTSSRYHVSPRRPRNRRA